MKRESSAQLLDRARSRILRLKLRCVYGGKTPVEERFWVTGSFCTSNLAGFLAGLVAPARQTPPKEEVCQKLIVGHVLS